MRWHVATFRHRWSSATGLNTDIAGANAAELPSLMVLTGVNSARDAVYAVPEQRATFIGHDLRSLHQHADELAVGPQSAWHIDTADDAITVSTAGDDEGDGLSIVRAVAHAVWSARGHVPSRPATTPHTPPCNGGP